MSFLIHIDQFANDRYRTECGIVIHFISDPVLTDRSVAEKKLCYRGFILALFQSTTANTIGSEHTRDNKRLLSVCEAKI